MPSRHRQECLCHRYLNRHRQERCCESILNLHSSSICTAGMSVPPMRMLVAARSPDGTDRRLARFRAARPARDLERQHGRLMHELALIGVAALTRWRRGKFARIGRLRHDGQRRAAFNQFVTRGLQEVERGFSEWDFRHRAPRDLAGGGLRVSTWPLIIPPSQVAAEHFFSGWIVSRNRRFCGAVGRWRRSESTY